MQTIRKPCKKVENERSGLLMALKKLYFDCPLVGRQIDRRVDKRVSYSALLSTR